MQINTLDIILHNVNSIFKLFKKKTILKENNNIKVISFLRDKEEYYFR